MSTVKEVVERDTVPADETTPPTEAPAEDAPATEGAPTEPPAEDEPADEATAAETTTEPDEADIEALFAEIERHWHTVGGIMGADFAQFEDCAYCAQTPTPFIGKVPAGSFTAPTVYLDDPDTVTCERCGGLGELATGAKNDHNKLRLCSTCQGAGFVDKNAPPPVSAFVPHVVDADPEAAALIARGYTVIPPFKPAS